METPPGSGPIVIGEGLADPDGNGWAVQEIPE
jgi:hypothetical protein